VTSPPISLLASVSVRLAFPLLPLLALALAPAACSSASAAAPSSDPPVSLGDASTPPPTEEVTPKPIVDGGYEGPDGSVVRLDRFVTEVVSFTPGDCAGFGIPKMPSIVLGPPAGAGALAGSLDVVSLGFEGEIVLGFGSNAIVDGPGPDFIVFENAFYANGDPNVIAADLGEVSVSDDGTTWTAFPCAPGPTPPYGSCAGWHPVYSSPNNGISPLDPATAGGDAYDLADLGLTHARFVRIRDKGRTTCPASPPKPTNAGFDLDAIAIVNAAVP
jgi:hypothetical protein